MYTYRFYQWRFVCISCSTHPELVLDKLCNYVAKSTILPWIDRGHTGVTHRSCRVHLEVTHQFVDHRSHGAANMADNHGYLDHGSSNSGREYFNAPDVQDLPACRHTQSTNHSRQYYQPAHVCNKGTRSCRSDHLLFLEFGVIVSCY